MYASFFPLTIISNFNNWSCLQLRIFQRQFHIGTFRPSVIHWILVTLLLSSYSSSRCSNLVQLVDNTWSWELPSVRNGLLRSVHALQIIYMICFHISGFCLLSSELWPSQGFDFISKSLWIGRSIKLLLLCGILKLDPKIEWINSTGKNRACLSSLWLVREVH